MRTVWIGLAWIATTAAVAEYDGLRLQLEAAGSADGQDYVEKRNALVATVPAEILRSAASNAGLDWKERLVARIVLERKLRGEDIEALRRYDWFSDPGFDPEWIQMMTGPSGHMAPLAQRRFGEAGLWYYYLEFNWKTTDEGIIHSRDRGLRYSWWYYAVSGLERQPEYYYLLRIGLDHMRSAAPFHVHNQRFFYNAFIQMQFADAVPTLVERFEQYYKATDPGTSEVFPGARSMTIRSVFSSLISIADERHVELLEAYITANPVLEPLRAELEAVRKRPAPEPIPEPPFRVMPTPEFLKNPPPPRDPAEARWPVLRFEQSNPPPEPEEVDKSNE